MIDYFKYDDKQLIALMREKHPVCNEAFNVIYYRYSEQLKSYCLFKSDNKEEAMELNQETWLKFHSVVHSGKISISLPTFLYTIAHSVIIDKYRINRNHLFYYDGSIDQSQFADPFNLQVNVENRDLLSLISLAINEIPELYRETFILKWFSGLKYHEIAEILGENTECVRQRSRRAFEEVLKVLKPIISDLKK
jgi:RNA polymerase sigma-70 factor (ECF subfamily)